MNIISSKISLTDFIEDNTYLILMQLQELGRATQYIDSLIVYYEKKKKLSKKQLKALYRIAEKYLIPYKQLALLNNEIRKM